jgi:hypothetical protein
MNQPTPTVASQLSLAAATALSTAGDLNWVHDLGTVIGEALAPLVEDMLAERDEQIVALRARVDKDFRAWLIDKDLNTVEGRMLYKASRDGIDRVREGHHQKVTHDLERAEVLIADLLRPDNADQDWDVRRATGRAALDS